MSKVSADSAEIASVVKSVISVQVTVADEAEGNVQLASTGWVEGSAGSY